MTQTAITLREQVIISDWYSRWRMALFRKLRMHYPLQSSDLEDIVQETFVRVVKYSHATALEHPFAYLFQAASNVVRERHERFSACQPHSDQWLRDLLISSDDEPEEQSIVEQRTLVVRAAISRLPVRERMILILHCHQEMTWKQIAIKLNFTPRMVRRDLARSYRRLREDPTLAKYLGIESDDLEQESTKEQL